MPTQDTKPIKESILNFLKTNGPSLPVQISKQIKMDSIFGSAFLSELLSQKRIKITNMKVGGSPIYYIEGTESQLEKYAQEYLKSKEKDAFLLLKEKKFLVDTEQEPAIRVALRSIKDFAKPFEKEGKVIWRYFLSKENEYQPTFQDILPQKESKQKLDKKEMEIKEEIKDKKINEKPEEEKIEQKKSTKKKTTKKKTSAKRKTQERKNEKFFNIVKENITKNKMEITDIIGFTKGHLTLKIKDNEKEKILVAYNKKRLTEADITNAHKKAKEHKLEYIIFALGEPAKKTTSFIEAIKDLSSIQKIE
jgi:hypothetical protein